MLLAAATLALAGGFLAECLLGNRSLDDVDEEVVGGEPSISTTA